MFRVERRNGYRVIVGGPVPPQADAITLGKTIMVRTSSAHKQGLLAHELVHVRQFAELGSIRFVARYLASYVRFRLGGYGHMAAYRRIPLEVEASWLSRLHRVAELEPHVPIADDADRVRLKRRPRANRQRSRRPVVHT